jgi:predicted SnoaL-like aldol condensation-catalyzing enzyme
MNKRYTPVHFIGMIILVCTSGTGFAQAIPYQIPTQKDMLYSPDPKLAANKKLVYDFWREVLEAGHLELAPEFMKETYIQHNPNVPTGRQGFIDFFSRFAKPVPIVDTIKGPLIDIVAENDMVVLVFKRQLPDPKDPSKKYITTSFEMLRVEGSLIAEHWDSATKE